MCLRTLKILLNPKGGCMKKLLVLALVLSMATMASAALVIGTSTNGPLAAGETAALTISTDAPMGFGLGDWNGAAIVVDLSKATITGGISLQPLEPGIAIFADAAVDLGFLVPTFPVENGVGFTFTFTGASISQPARSLIRWFTQPAVSSAMSQLHFGAHRIMQNSQIWAQSLLPRFPSR